LASARSGGGSQIRDETMQHPSRRAVVFGLAAAAVSFRVRASSASVENRVNLANERLAAIEAREGAGSAWRSSTPAAAQGLRIAPANASQCAARSS
jgi:hypothetical protein